MALGKMMGLGGNPAYDAFDSRRNALMGVGAGLLSGNWGNMGKYAMQGAQIDAENSQTQQAEQERAEQLNQTVQFLQEKHPDLAQMVQSGMPVAEAWGTALKRMEPGTGPDAPSSVREWEYFNALPPEQQAQYINMKRANPYLNTGTEFVQPNPAAPGQVAGEPIPINNEQKAFDTAVGAGLGGANADRIAAAPQEIANAEKSIALIDKMIGNEEMGIPEHPGLEETFGTVAGVVPQQLTPAWPGTPKADFQALREQMSGKLFLEAYATLKGGGQITEVEGLKAEQAMARMQVAQSKGAFIEAMKEFREAVATGMAKLQAHAQGGGRAAPAPTGGQTSTGVPWSIE